MRNGTIAESKLRRIWVEENITYFKTLSQHLHGQTDNNHAKQPKLAVTQPKIISNISTKSLTATIRKYILMIFLFIIVVNGKRQFTFGSVIQKSTCFHSLLLNKTNNSCI
jgi:hypothetical protein